jgi:hypothetical protein
MTAESLLELLAVEPEVLDSPKSSASDSLLGFKVFSRELIELEVLIPFLLQKSVRRKITAHASLNGFLSAFLAFALSTVACAPLALN